MKKDSLVYCVDNSGQEAYLKKNEPYPVRAVKTCVCGRVFLDVGVNCSPQYIISQCGECGMLHSDPNLFRSERFREIQFPPSLEEEISQALSVQLV